MSDWPKISQAADFGKVAVLYGGASAEREISLLTGKAVHAALLERVVAAHLLDATGDYLFGEIWSRDGLGLRDRSLVTIAALLVLGREREFAIHLNGALNVGQLDLSSCRERLDR